MSLGYNNEAGIAFDSQRAIERLKNGDQRAGDELVRQIHRIVRRRLKRLSATDQECDELVQECTIGILQRVSEYRTELGSFEGWASGFAQNTWRSYMRAIARQRRSFVPMEEIGAAHYEISTEINQRENLANALESLDLIDRELLHMKFSMGMSSEEIATASDMNAPQVRKRISRAVERLRRHPATQSLLLSIGLL